MEYLYYNKENQIRIERFVLAVYTLYGIGMSVIALVAHWAGWLIIFIDAGVIISWFVFCGRYKNYHFRAFLTAVMLQVSVIIYILQTGNLMTVLPTFLALVILLGLYGVPDLVYIPLVATSFLIFYFGFITDSLIGTSQIGNIRTVLQLASVYFVEYLIYYMVKKQVEVNDALLETIGELQDAEHSKDDFLTNVSHEIRTPINTICGMSEVVLREDIPAKTREDVFNIQAAGRNLFSVVSDILDFSELQSGKMQLVEETYNITSTLNDIINMAMARKNQKHIELIVDCDANIPCGLFGDEQKIRRVIMNLVNNAIKFTDDGCVSIIVGCRKTNYGANLSVTVKDTGIGMKEESLERLFTSFSQVDTRRNRQEGGIGLGLAISQAIVDMMGGFITVRSEFGKGSELQFVVPQKVVDETPITSVHNKENLNVAVYIDMEQFELLAIRDEYTRNITHMYTQLGVACHMCRNLAELKRRVSREDFSHIFISFVEYQEDTAYFDELSLHTKLILVIDRPDEAKISNPHLLRLYKPFYILPIVMMLNGEKVVQGMDDNNYHKDKFIAPDAHILIVDDNLMNIKVVEGLLKPYQIHVTTAVSGPEALEKIESMDYDFVFMDHMMPEMDGIETLHRIRQKRGMYFSKVPIIALTANAVAGTREMFLEEGFQDFVAKPVETSVLQRVLKRTLPEHKIILLENEADIEAREEPMREEQNEALVIGDLDINKGLTFCGSEENYFEILRMHCMEGEENKEKISHFYEEKDWKNYTILVHALKSSMMSIGAAVLSQMAKGLEQAGKEENAGFIADHHDAMMEEYDRVLTLIRQNKQIWPDGGEEVPAEDLPELTDEAFDDLVKDFEKAVYTLKVENVRSVLNQLQQYSYHGHSLKALLESLEEKVEMSDFMSAYDAVIKVGKRLRNQ